MRNMQKVILIVFIVVSLLTIACGRMGGNKAVGTWVASMTRAEFAALSGVDEGTLEAMGVAESFEFAHIIYDADGTCQMIGISPIDSSQRESQVGTYTIKGNEISMLNEDGEDEIILTIDRNILTGNFGGLQMTFEKVRS